MIDDETIQGLLVEHGEDLDRTCDALIAAANEAGGDDNISVVVLRYTADEE